MTLHTTRRRILPGLLLILLGGCGADPAQEETPEPRVLAQAATDLDTDRPWSAARLLRPYATGDLDPEARLLAARAEAGAGNWDRVRAS